MRSPKTENTKSLQQKTSKWPNLVSWEAEKSTTSTEAESVETATPTTGHDGTHHTLMNALHVEASDTGQDAAEKILLGSQETKKTSLEQIPLLSAS